MQPRTLAIAITLIPLFAINAVYLYSAWHHQVPWCIPYLEGCTSISRAARRGDAIYLFRALVIPQAVLLMLYWHYARRWLVLLGSSNTTTQRNIQWTGTFGATFLILYADFLGSDGEVYRMLRHYGIMLYFTLTALAQMVLLGQLYKLRATSASFAVSASLLNYQLTIFMLILALGLTSVTMNYAGISTFESESIVEWDFSLLLIALSSAMIFMWKDFRTELTLKQ